MNSKHATKKLGWGEGLVTMAIICMLLGILLPSIGRSREAVRCYNCVQNMKQIGIALRNYHDHFGSFPPAYTVDEEGNPLHSWRTLILPYFDSKAIDPKWKSIYDEIRFDEPWDSEHNIQFNAYVEHDGDKEEAKYHHANPDKDMPFHHNMPAVYGCPCYGSNEETVKTVYKMVIGDHTIGNSKGTSLSQIKRPLDKTILLLEAAQTVPWMSPSDFTVEDFKTALYPNEASEIRTAEWKKVDEEYKATGVYPFWKSETYERPILGGNHGYQLHVLFADGTVKAYKDWKLPISEIESMSRIKE